MVYLLKMVIFHSYDSLPEGICSIIREKMWNQRRLRLKWFRFCGFFGFIQNPNTAILRESSRMAMKKYKPSLPKQISKNGSRSSKPTHVIGGVSWVQAHFFTWWDANFLGIRGHPQWPLMKQVGSKSSQIITNRRRRWHWGYYEHPWK